MNHEDNHSPFPYQKESSLNNSKDDFHFLNEGIQEDNIDDNEEEMQRIELNFQEYPPKKSSQTQLETDPQLKQFYQRPTQQKSVTSYKMTKPSSTSPIYNYFGEGNMYINQKNEDKDDNSNIAFNCFKKESLLNSPTKSTNLETGTPNYTDFDFFAQQHNKMEFQHRMDSPNNKHINPINYDNNNNFEERRNDEQDEGEIEMFQNSKRNYELNKNNKKLPFDAMLKLMTQQPQEQYNIPKGNEYNEPINNNNFLLDNMNNNTVPNYRQFNMMNNNINNSTSLDNITGFNQLNNKFQINDFNNNILMKTNNLTNSMNEFNNPMNNIFHNQKVNQMNNIKHNPINNVFNNGMSQLGGINPYNKTQNNNNNIQNMFTDNHTFNNPFFINHQNEMNLPQQRTQQQFKREDYIFEKFGKKGWQCNHCNNFNFEIRVKCNKCHNPMNPKLINKNRRDTLLNIDDKKKKPLIERKGDWLCPKCRNLNFAFRLICNRCQLPKNEGNTVPSTYNNMNMNLMNQNNYFNI